MKILIVFGEQKQLKNNGHPAQNLTNHQKFLLTTIKRLLLNQALVPVTESDMVHSVQYRLMNDLDDYLYDYQNRESKYRNPDSIKRFDYLDIVIVDIDPTILPW